MENIELNPYDKSFKFERLKANYSGYCSKRVNKKDRIIYKVEDEKITVLVVSITGHYDDK